MTIPPLNKREYAAVQILVGICSNSAGVPGVKNADDVIERVVYITDKLLTELKRTEEPAP